MKLKRCLTISTLTLTVAACGAASKTGIIQKGGGSGPTPTSSSPNSMSSKQLTMSSGSGKNAQTCLSLANLSNAILATKGEIAVNTYDLDFGSGTGKTFKSATNNDSLDSGYFLAGTSTIRPVYKVLTTKTAASDTLLQSILVKDQPDCGGQNTTVTLSSGTTATIAKASNNYVSITTGTGPTLKTMNYTVTATGFIVEMYSTPQQLTICGNAQPAGLVLRESYAVSSGSGLSSLPVSPNLYSLLSKHTDTGGVMTSTSTPPPPSSKPSRASTSGLHIDPPTYLLITEDVNGGTADTGCAK